MTEKWSFSTTKENFMLWIFAVTTQEDLYVWEK